jgi:hypothetical protein
MTSLHNNIIITTITSTITSIIIISHRMQGLDDRVGLRSVSEGALHRVPPPLHPHLQQLCLNRHDSRSLLNPS